MICAHHYNDSSNYITKDALTDGSVTKIGTSTVGSGLIPIYLNAGTPTASTSTAGASNKATYLKAGQIYEIDYYLNESIYNATITDNFQSQARTDIGVTNTNQTFFSNIQLGANTITGVGRAYSPGIFFGKGNTQVYITADYDSSFQQAHIGGGTNDAITWTRNIVLSTSNTAVGGSNNPVYVNSNGIATVCNEFMPIAGTTFTGAAYAYTNTNYTTYQLRNIAFTTSTPSSLTNGYVCMVYS